MPSPPVATQVARPPPRDAMFSDQRLVEYMFTALNKGYVFNESAVPNSILSTVFHQSLIRGVFRGPC